MYKLVIGQTYIFSVNSSDNDRHKINVHKKIIHGKVINILSGIGDISSNSLTGDMPLYMVMDIESDYHDPKFYVVSCDDVRANKYGINIIDVIKSGKKAKRPHMASYYDFGFEAKLKSPNDILISFIFTHRQSVLHLTYDDILADDWILEQS